jgi:hypothetical protein
LIFPAALLRRKFRQPGCRNGQQTQAYPGEFAMGELQRASDQESLRLVLAFFRIDDPSQRLAVITLAEWFADEACSGPRGSSPPFSRHDRELNRPRS